MGLPAWAIALLVAWPVVAFLVAWWAGRLLARRAQEAILQGELLKHHPSTGLVQEVDSPRD